MADALRDATEASYAAVGTPVEGTMLTVARAASDAAAGRGRRPRRAGPRRLHRRGRRAPGRPWRARPSSSQALRDAGVVDAGGRG